MATNAADNEKNKGLELAGSLLDDMRGGLVALSQVHAAQTLCGSLKDERDELEAARQDIEDELSWRKDVLLRYSDIVSEQTRQIARAHEDLAQSKEEERKLLSEVDALSVELKSLKAEHEEKLRPYKELAEASKGRADDAARALAELKRSHKAAENQVAEVTKKRDVRVAQATRAVDSAQERLVRVENELRNLQQDPKSAAGAQAKMQSEVVAERAHLDAANAELAKIQKEAQRQVENAQTHLWTQKDSLELAEGHHETAKQTADEHRKEYERLYNIAQDEEKDLSGRIKARQSEIEKLGRVQNDLLEQQNSAELILQEAQEVHAHPEKLETLAEDLAAKEKSLAQKDLELQEAEAKLQALKHATKRQRLVVFVALGILLAVIIGIIALVLL